MKGFPEFIMREIEKIEIEILIDLIFEDEFAESNNQKELYTAQELLILNFENNINLTKN